MKKYGIVLALFAVLTIVYFRNAIFSPADMLITRHLGTDLYIYFLHAQDHLNWLQQGFVAVGNYWVPHGGGFPATPFDQLLVPSNLLLIGLYATTHNFLVALKIYDPLIYFGVLVATYWYGTVLFKGKTILPILIAVAFAFSMYNVDQLEHLDLMSAAIFVPVTLGFFEKMLRDTKPKDVVLTGIFAFLTYLTHLYAFTFLAGFMILRFVYELATAKDRLKKVIAIAKMLGIVVLAALPFLVMNIAQSPPQFVKDDLAVGLERFAQPPGLYFARSLPDYFTADARTVYIGLAVMLTALIPIILKKTNRTYIFYLCVTMLTVLYAVGRYGPFNLAQLVHDYIPLTFFIRVPGRALIIGYLTLGVCAAIGLSQLLDLIKSHRKQFAVACAIIVIIFLDLTIGYEPPVVKMALAPNGAYAWLSQQEGSFRVEEVPAITTQMATSDMYIGHDTLTPTRWAYNYFEPLYAPADMYYKYLDKTATAIEATFYDVKYVIVNTDPNYYTNYIAQALKDIDGPTLDEVLVTEAWMNSNDDFKVVYDKDGYTVYENLLYKGFVIPVGDASVTYDIINPNNITIRTESHYSTAIIICQCYEKGWRATLEDGTALTISESSYSTQRIDVPAGQHIITLHYSNYEKSLLWFLSYIPLAGLIAILLTRKPNSNKKILS